MMAILLEAARHQQHTHEGLTMLHPLTRQYFTWLGALEAKRFLLRDNWSGNGALKHLKISFTIIKNIFGPSFSFFSPIGAFYFDLTVSTQRDQAYAI